MKWTVLKALKSLHEKGNILVNKSVITDPKVKHLVYHTHELKLVGKHLYKGDGFDVFYERYYEKKIVQYQNFLERNDLLKPQTRFEESDIQVLMDIEMGMENGELDALRSQIIASEETVRGVSRMFFKHEKYLLNKESLIKAVKKLLNITKLADDRDQQYKYVLECDEPKCIVLCENIDFLKRPTRPRENSIELWYAGGRNIHKLEYADVASRNLPIYYSCDWDKDGLEIFESILEKIPQIKLLYPNGSSLSLKDTDHKSNWNSKPLSGLNESLYNVVQKELIHDLIDNEEWIMEESNDLIDMVESILFKVYK